MEVTRSSTICAALADAGERFAHLDALSAADAGRWRTVTVGELCDMVHAASRGLEAMGLRPATVVPVFAASSVEQTAAELAAVHAGAVTAPLPARAPMCAVAALARRWPVDLAVVDSNLAIVLVRRVLGPVKIVVLGGATPPGEGVITWEDALALGRRASSWGQRTAADAAVGMCPGDPAAVIATRAPDDAPVVVSHRGIAAAEHLARCLETRPGDRLVVCVDPEASSEVWALKWHALVTGATRYLLPPAQDITAALRQVRPTVFAADSCGWEELADVVRTALAQRNGELDEARAVGLEVARLSPAETPTETVARYAAVASALAGVRALVGLDECRAALALGQLPADVDALFRSVGLPIRTRVNSPRQVSQLTSVRASGL